MPIARSFLLPAAACAKEAGATSKMPSLMERLKADAQAAVAAAGPETEGPAALVRASAVMAKLGDGLGMAARLGHKWKQTVAVKQMSRLDYRTNLDQLCDVWARADVAGGGDGLDPEEFQQAFRGHFPPWKQPVGAEFVDAALVMLFKKIDANGDGRVSWDEFSDFVLAEAMQSHRIEKEEVSVFNPVEYDNQFNDPGAFHKDLITAVVNVGAKNQYVSSSRDGSIRIWGSTTQNHIHTIRISDKPTQTWITGITIADGYKSAQHPLGVLVSVASDRVMRLYDMKNFALLGAVMLPDDVSPLCCSGFDRKDVLRRSKLTTAEYFIMVGDTDGKILVYEQNSAFLSHKRERQALPGLENPLREKTAAVMTVTAHCDHVTQIGYVKGIDRIVSSSLDGKVCVLDPVTLDCNYFYGHSKPVLCTCYVSTYSYFASSGQEREILLWSPYTQKRITSLVGHQAAVKCMVYNCTHMHLISMSSDKEVIIWDPKTYERICSVQDTNTYRPEDLFTAMTWDGKNKKLILAHSRLQIWPYKGEVNEGLGLVLHKSEVMAALCNDTFGNIVTLDASGLVILWKTDTGIQQSAWSIKHDLDEKVTCAAFDKSERRLLVGSNKGRVWIYNWNSGIRLNELRSEMDSDVSCVLNTVLASKKHEIARGNTVATGWNRFVYVWHDPPDSYTLSAIKKIDLHIDCDVRSMTYIQQTQQISFAMYNGMVTTWRATGNWKNMHKIDRGRNSGLIPSIGSANSALDSARDATSSLKSPHLGRGDDFWLRDTFAVNVISFLSCWGLPFPLIIASGMDGYVRLYDCLNGQLRGVFDAGHVGDRPDHDGHYPRQAVLDMASEPSQKMIGTTDSQGNIRTFDVTSVTDEVITLHLSVIGAQGLPAADGDGFSDPYCRCILKSGQLAKQEAKTKHKSKTLDPDWGEGFTYVLGSGKRSEIMKHNWKLEFIVLDYDRFGTHDELGVASLDVSKLTCSKKKDLWLDLLDPDPDDAYEKNSLGRLHVAIELVVEFNAPEVFSSWKAHEDSISSFQLSKPSASSDGSNLPLLISASHDCKVKVWTMAGVLVGILGGSVWDSMAVKSAHHRGAAQRAELLLHKVKQAQELSQLEDKLQRDQEAKEQAEYESNKDRLEDLEEERRRNLAKERAKQEYITRLENSEDVNLRVKAIPMKMGIPEETYENLSQAVLDGILTRKGNKPEENETVFSKVSIEGLSSKEYTIKTQPVHGWEFGKLKDMGVFRKDAVEYGMVNVERVPWDADGSEYPEVIVQKPSNTVAAMNRSDHDCGISSPDPVLRSKSPYLDANSHLSCALSGVVTKGQGTARASPVNQAPAGFTSSDREATEPITKKIGVLDASGFTPNLTKLLTSSKPPQRPTGSWTYKNFSDTAIESVAVNRDFPKFNPMRFVKSNTKESGIQQAQIEDSAGRRVVPQHSQDSAIKFKLPLEKLGQNDSGSLDSFRTSFSSHPKERLLVYPNFGRLRVPVPTTRGIPGQRESSRNIVVARLEITGPFSERGRPRTARASASSSHRNYQDMQTWLSGTDLRHPMTARPATSRLNFELEPRKSRLSLLRAYNARKASELCNKF